MDALRELGVDATYLGQEDNPRRIAAAVIAQSADAVEMCVGGCGGVTLLRAVLRELNEIGRQRVSVVPHRIG